eukprot:CAMPEP_0174385428 /NCGR_PEP_ID=MMETSP0811_2-20130205/126591_1 /TAXON_ID=73025 ORGANISM="Eutreptiella gymnastica-like, Strain CCMP1594" /NCGR_SAMPLE_ID=MMETSP0811_2 /ASSEMBLY_ACC=CAM_ASM_000667 /LENGTH=147 /DNA_ID=CAMNT_0015539739 /DNA_START=2732 /DNA_END=3175 /DNA_ORIENTATION=+
MAANANKCNSGAAGQSRGLTAYTHMAQYSAECPEHCVVCAVCCGVWSGCIVCARMGKGIHLPERKGLPLPPPTAFPQFETVRMCPPTAGDSFASAPGPTSASLPLSVGWAPAFDMGLLRIARSAAVCSTTLSAAPCTTEYPRLTAAF